MKWIQVLSIVLFSLAFSYPTGDWELKKDKNGIQIYTRSKVGSNFKEFKAVTTITASVASLVAIMQDTSSYPVLFPLTSHRELLEEEGETFNVQYIQTDVPFPVSDRDGIYSFDYGYDSNTGAVRIYIKSLPDYLPRKKKWVRITTGDGYWKFTPKENGTVEIIYQFHVEPGGSIPAWLANAQVVESPWKAMTGLVKLAPMPKYQNQTFSFMK